MSRYSDGGGMCHMHLILQKGSKLIETVCISIWNECTEMAQFSNADMHSPQAGSETQNSVSMRIQLSAFHIVHSLYQLFLRSYLKVSCTYIYINKRVVQWCGRRKVLESPAAPALIFFAWQCTTLTARFSTRQIRTPDYLRTQYVGWLHNGTAHSNFYLATTTHLLV